MDKYDLINEEDIVKQIEQADELQLDEIISAVMHRYNALHTDRDASFLSLPTDPHARDENLENIFRFIRSCYAQTDSQCAAGKSYCRKNLF